MRDGEIYAAVSDKLQLKEIAAKDAEIERLRDCLAETIGNLSSVAEAAESALRRANEHFDSIDQQERGKE